MWNEAPVKGQAQDQKVGKPRGPVLAGALGSLPQPPPNKAFIHALKTRAEPSGCRALSDASTSVFGLRLGGEGNPVR